eukprot:g25812.t1
MLGVFVGVLRSPPPEANMLPRDDRGKKPKALERAPDPTRPKVQVGSGSKDITQEAMRHMSDIVEDDDLFSFQWPDGVPRTANHPDFRHGSRSCGEDIFNELKEEMHHPLNTGFATPTQSTDLSFLSQMRQKLLRSKAENKEDFAGTNAK